MDEPILSTINTIYAISILMSVLFGDWMICFAIIVSHLFYMWAKNVSSILGQRKLHQKKANLVKRRKQLLYWRVLKSGNTREACPKKGRIGTSFVDVMPTIIEESEGYEDNKDYHVAKVDFVFDGDDIL